MSDAITILPAAAADADEIKMLLAATGLPTMGVDEHWKTFVVARENGRLVGCGGAEAYRTSALIRSVAVAPGSRRQGLGRRLVRQLLDRLSARGLREFYLLTDGAEPWFAKRGFTRIGRDEVTDEVRSSSHFQQACPDTAVCMRLRMLG